MKPKMKASWILLVLLGTGLLLTAVPATKSAGQGTVGAGNACSLIGKLVWTSNRDGNYDIFIMDEDGGNPTQLTFDNFPTINQHPVFTPDCEEIVWSRSGTLWKMKTDGSNQTLRGRLRLRFSVFIAVGVLGLPVPSLGVPYTLQTELESPDRTRLPPDLLGRPPAPS